MWLRSGNYARSKPCLLDSRISLWLLLSSLTWAISKDGLSFKRPIGAAAALQRGRRQNCGSTAEVPILVLLGYFGFTAGIYINIKFSIFQELAILQHQQTCNITRTLMVLDASHLGPHPQIQKLPSTKESSKIPQESLHESLSLALIPSNQPVQLQYITSLSLGVITLFVHDIKMKQNYFTL